MNKQNNIISAEESYLGSAVSEIRELLNQSRKNVATQVNQELLSTYWRIGEMFYLTYQKCQTVSGKLSWSHYCELMMISDTDKRSFYEKECVNSGWSVRELKRQKESMLFKSVCFD